MKKELMQIFEKPARGDCNDLTTLRRVEDAAALNEEDRGYRSDFGEGPVYAMDAP